MGKHKPSLRRVPTGKRGKNYFERKSQGRAKRCPDCQMFNANRALICAKCGHIFKASTPGFKDTTPGGNHRARWLDPNAINALKLAAALVKQVGAGRARELIDAVEIIQG